MRRTSFSKPSSTLRRTAFALAGAAALALGGASAAQAAGAAEEPKDVAFSWEGPFGTFDRAALQRGFQVYKEVCASCHSLKFVKYRNLGDPGGPGFSDPEVKAIAAAYQITDGPNDEGDMFERPGLPKDAFKSPFENEQLAKLANGGSLPPDLSLMTKARDGGADYLYSLLTGYEDTPPRFEAPAGGNYNPYFTGSSLGRSDFLGTDEEWEELVEAHEVPKGGFIAMAQPLYEDSVSYADGTPATVEQMSKDVTTFLHWAAEPKLEARKQTGFMVMTFLVILAGLLYFTQRKIWSDQH